MANVKKAKYIYVNGVYYQVGGDDEELLKKLDNLILVQDTQPTSPDNKIWIKETATPVVIPDMDDIADFVSFAEDQTSRTAAEKEQARANIEAAWELQLLWENASPTSNFAAQTVSLDLSPYKLVLINFKWATDDDARHFGIVKVGEKLSTCNIYNNRIVREATTSSTGISFAGGLQGSYSSNISSNNKYAIPTEIYGLKA